MSGKQNPSHLHHWFPEALSFHWANSEGKIIRVNTDNGQRNQAIPSVFGGREKWHVLDFGKTSPWTTNFESQFHHADRRMNRLVAKLNKLTGTNRLQSQPIDIETRQLFATCCASFLARLPGTRRRLEKYIRQWPGPQNTDEEIKRVNLPGTARSLFDSYTSIMMTSGTFAIFTSANLDFIYGDGLYHTFPLTAIFPVDGRPLHVCAKCIVPITPSIAVIYIAPCPTSILLICNLEPHEAVHINRATQVNSKELFFRRHEPNVFSQQDVATSERWLASMFNFVATCDPPAQKA